MWLAQVGRERIEETIDPEQTGVPVITDQNASQLNKVVVNMVEAVAKNEEYYNNRITKIVLIIDGSNCHRFTQNGHTTNRGFVKMIGRKKVRFPLSYEMEQINRILLGKF